MALEKIVLRVGKDQAGQRLDQFIFSALSSRSKNLSKSAIRKLIVAGAVYLNRSRTRIASKTVIEGAQVEVWVDWQRVSTKSREESWTVDRTWILFEDEDLVFVNKPPGLPTQPTLDQARANLFNLTKAFLKSPYLAMHHRLDRDTSGVILFAKTERVNKAVGEAFAHHTARKHYQAICRFLYPSDRKIGDSFVVEGYLKKKEGGSKRAAKMVVAHAGGDFARTSFTLEDRFKEFALVSAYPETGRMHQIRVHLAETGAPILGDELYGGSAQDASRVMLHAASLTIPHPIHKTELKIICPLPKDFQTCLERLKGKNPAS